MSSTGVRDTRCWMISSSLMSCCNIISSSWRWSSSQCHLLLLIPSMHLNMLFTMWWRFVVYLWFFISCILTGWCWPTAWTVRVALLPMHTFVVRYLIFQPRLDMLIPVYATLRRCKNSSRSLLLQCMIMRVSWPSITLFSCLRSAIARI